MYKDAIRAAAENKPQKLFELAHRTIVEKKLNRQSLAAGLQMLQFQFPN